jgi:hypothetical protein
MNADEEDGFEERFEQNLSRFKFEENDLMFNDHGQRCPPDCNRGNFQHVGP